MQKIRIIIVEEKAPDARELADRLEQLGYDVCGYALSGEEALEKTAGLKPDLVFMDIRIAGEIDGVETARQLRDRLNVPIIYLAGQADGQDLVKSQITEPFSYLLSPFEESDIRTSVEISLYRHSLEEKLRESEEKEELYRDLFENATDLIQIVSPEGSFKYVNRSWRETFGYCEKEIPDLTLFSIIDPACENHCEKTFSRMLSEGRLDHIETAFIAKDGRKVLLEGSGNCKYKNGKVVSVRCIFRDMTTRREAENELRRNYDTQAAIDNLLRISIDDLSIDEFLKHALDIILTIPWLTLESKGSIFLADEAQDVLAMKVHKGLDDALLNECSSVLFGKCLCGRAALTRRHQYSDGIDEDHDISYEGMRPHGHYCIPILSSDKTLGVMNLYIKEGHPQDQRELAFLDAIANVLAGIIRRMQLEKEKEALISDLRISLSKVSQSQKMWQETFDSIRQMISVLDKEGNIISVNRTFAEYFGLNPKEAVSKKCQDLFRSSECPLHEGPSGGMPSSYEMKDPLTGRVLVSSIFPFHFPDAEFDGFIHITRDITEEREREMRLIMSERLASLGQMASGIAHEINNPLAAIAGCAEGLLGRVRNGKYSEELFERYLKIIGEEIVRCKNITTGMLSVVRASTYDKKSFHINETIEKTLEIIGFQGRLKNVGVIKNLGQSIPTIDGSEGELKQVFLSVITNALDAMEDRGTLTIETGTDDKNIYVRISDSGSGIPKENMAKIFNPFFTTKSDKGGTGLGLSIANKIVINHDGAITVTADEGRGTTFTISLPAGRRNKDMPGRES